MAFLIQVWALLRLAVINFFYILISSTFIRRLFLLCLYVRLDNSNYPDFYENICRGMVLAQGTSHSILRKNHIRMQSSKFLQRILPYCDIRSSASTGVCTRLVLPNYFCTKLMHIILLSTAEYRVYRSLSFIHSLFGISYVTYWNVLYNSER